MEPQYQFAKGLDWQRLDDLFPSAGPRWDILWDGKNTPRVVLGSFRFRRHVQVWALEKDPIGRDFAETIIPVPSYVSPFFALSHDWRLLPYPYNLSRWSFRAWRYDQWIDDWIKYPLT